MTPDSANQRAGHACPVCGDAGQIAHLCRVDGADVYTCKTCTADHVYPPPSAQALKAYYDRESWFEGGEKGGYQNYDAQTAPGQIDPILAQFAGREGLSILDVGCGYGTHLAAAAKAGWKCFGVEPSAHARKVAQERLGGAAYVVGDVSELIPHEFDVVLMLDVVEHLPSPYPTLYQLFSIGAITAKTTAVISTPNAGSAAAKRDPAAWDYRHPASHLVHYTGDALRLLLKRLHFTSVDVRGTVPDGTDLSASAGLMVTARGSDFAEFMRERYVPGTWSRLAEYEHLPRYALAKTLAAGKTILDFGCGTGYGAALVSQVAKHVTGLDIDAAALNWARENHKSPRLDFQRHCDLGATLPAASFDMVTCFEMIEHVDHATQKATAASIARLLKDDGVLLISTPNPAVTALYGANPYHIREMNQAEFRELLSPHFPHINILRQFVRVGVALDQENDGDKLESGVVGEHTDESTNPMAFIALCSRKALPPVPARVLFDPDTDYVGQFMAKEKAIASARLRAYVQGEFVQSLTDQVRRVASQRDTARNNLHDSLGRLDTTQRSLDSFTQRLMSREQELIDLEDRRAREAVAAGNALINKQNELDALAREREALVRQREAELNSPRFLARRLKEVIGARLRAKFKGKP